MTRLIHPIAGALALVIIATFWLSTVLTELFGSSEAVTALKQTIPWGFLVLVPALATTGGSGLRLAGGGRRGVIGAKARRMPIIAANGILVLVPSALFLASKAGAGEFDRAFYLVQAIELLAGATNLTLLGLSMRDGLAATRWRRRSLLRPQPPQATALLKRERTASGTVDFELAKPPGFTFTAGQAVYLTFPTVATSDDAGRVRTFSIASAPGEQTLRFATRSSDSGFKRQLLQLPTGASLALEGPYGDLALPDDANQPCVFLAGGIGITPFRSMILDAVRRGLAHPLVLFFSTRALDDTTFLSELTELAQRTPSFTLVPTITSANTAPTDWTGETGVISAAMLRRHVRDLATPVFYVGGPPAMTTAMQAMLLEAGVGGERIRVEAFPGY